MADFLVDDDDESNSDTETDDSNGALDETLERTQRKRARRCVLSDDGSSVADDEGVFFIHEMTHFKVSGMESDTGRDMLDDALKPTQRKRLKRCVFSDDDEQWGGAPPLSMPSVSFHNLTATRQDGELLPAFILLLACRRLYLAHDAGKTASCRYPWTSRRAYNSIPCTK